MNEDRLDHPAFCDRAAAELSAKDAILGSVIAAAGPLRLRLEPNRFRMLVRGILSQQISMTSAKATRLRFEKLLSGKRVTPARVRGLTVKEVRAAGLTRQKTRYVLEAAAAIDEGVVSLSRLSRMSDDEATAELTKLVGVGRWTAEMLLMFSLGRPDLFPVGDLGVRNAIASLYGVEGPDECEALAERWRPYRSVATWYLWRHADAADVTQGLESYPV